MINVLSDSELDTLRALTAREVMLAFDYDGTLAPIVDDPAQAYMTASTRELLWQVSQRYPVIVITGRAQPDALHRLRGVGVLEVVGNHGIEPRNAANRYAEQVKRWSPVLEACAAAWPGVTVEDKIYSVAVHYRHARDKAAAHAAIRECAEGLERARVLGGKEVVNIMPLGAADKGTALLREQQRLHCSTAIYVGDDETDEDVFVRASPGTGPLLGIRVGTNRRSAATHFIPDQQSIERLLQILIDLRREALRPTS